MKNILIFIVLGVFISSCSKSKYANIDNQFAKKENQYINGKYNNKNLVQQDKRKREAIRQLAIVTIEE